MNDTELENEILRIHGYFQQLAKTLSISKIMDLIYSFPNPDIDIKIEGETKRLHRHILAARSGTFKRLLVRDERVPIHELYVNGMKASVFNMIVCYSYTGFMPDEVKDLGVMLELYEAAINYEMPHVLAHCRHKILKLITNIKNWEEVSKLVSLYNDSTLREFMSLFYEKIKNADCDLMEIEGL